LVVTGVAVLAWRAGWVAGARAVPALGVLQRAGLVALRALVLLGLVAIVMRPVRLAPDPSARGHVMVLIDVSRSMALADADGTARLDAARALVRDHLVPAAADRLALEIFAFGDEVEAVPSALLGQLEATAPVTDVSRALDMLRRHASRQPTGVVLVSDGGFVLPESRTPGKGGADPPVFTVGVGAAAVERDLEVRELTAGDAPVAGATIDLTATVVSTGYGTSPVELRLSANGRPLDVRRVSPAGNGLPTEVVFAAAPDTATATLFTIEAVAREGELTPDNNRRAVLVAPPGRARRVLLLEGAPGFEHTFLKRALDQDLALELDSVVRKGRNEAGLETFYVQANAARGRQLTDGFPASRQSLFAYDAVVLANLEPHTLSADQMALLADYVAERGGGLLILGARSYDAAAVAGTVLEELLPVEVSDRRSSAVARAQHLPTPGPSGVGLTPDGERHPIMRLGATDAESLARWASLPPLASVASVGQARAGATVLAVAEGPGGVARPLVTIQRYGRGRVLAFSGEAAWRWRMLLPSTDTAYPTFWRQAARWLAAATPEPVMLRTRPSGADGLDIQVEVRDEGFVPVRDAGVRVQIRGSDGTTLGVEAVPDPDTAGAYRAQARLPPGVSRVDVEAVAKGATLGRATTWALAGPDEGEFVEPRRHDAQLARLAERFDGRLVRPPELPALVDELARRSASTAAFVERDLWQTPWIMMGLLALLVMEWALRRRWGLR
jgi:uncharacterized membrane protein